MAEFCRAAQIAARSTSLLRSSTLGWSSRPFSAALRSPIISVRHLTTTQVVRSIESGNRIKDPTTSSRSPSSQTQQQNDSSDGWLSDPQTSWPSDPQNSWPSQLNKVEIKKPDSSAYDDLFAPEIDFETGELDKSKVVEERPTPTRPPLRLVPRTGRTVHVGRNVDVARSFRLLDVQMGQNRVRNDVARQKYHERPGLKRKRLKSERWQKRFKKGFKACVSRVKELTKQGW